MENRNKKPAKMKPRKPRPDFPLFAHSCGMWAKTINYKTVYFGPWDKPKQAEEKYEKLMARKKLGFLENGEKVQVRLHEVVNAFLTAKEEDRDAGDIEELTFKQYHEICGEIIRQFGREVFVDELGPADFRRYRTAWRKKLQPKTVNHKRALVQMVFNWALHEGVIPKPVSYGHGFDKVSAENVQIEENEKPDKLFTAAQIRALLQVAPMPLKVMILLGINCGFGNNDCASLPINALDLEGGWHNFARPKNGTKRRAKLWPETIKAIKEWLEMRQKPESKKDAQLVFITPEGENYKDTVSTERVEEEYTTRATKSPISKAFRKLTVTLGIYQRGISFYALRHTFRTIADGCRDQPAVYHVMGHKMGDMSDQYRHGIDDYRLVDVANLVREWLFPELATGTVPMVTVKKPAPLAIEGPKTVAEAEIVQDAEEVA